MEGFFVEELVVDWSWESVIRSFFITGRFFFFLTGLAVGTGATSSTCKIYGFSSIV